MAAGKLGSLTGGDCAGRNPVLRAVAPPAQRAALEVIGIRNAWQDLMKADLEPLDGELLAAAEAPFR